MLLIDFRDAEESGRWQSIDDVVMGGRSKSSFSFTAEQTSLFHGFVSLDQGGGFASVRRNWGHLDLSDAAGLQLKCRGDGCVYKFNLRLEKSFDGIVWQTGFDPVMGEWELIDLSFEAFEATFHGRVLPHPPRFDPARICSFGLLVGGGQEGAFRLELEWLKSLPTGDAA